MFAALSFFHRGNSSADRASPSQGEGRGFEPRFPLQTFQLVGKAILHPQ